MNYNDPAWYILRGDQAYGPYKDEQTALDNRHRASEQVKNGILDRAGKFIQQPTEHTGVNMNKNDLSKPSMQEGKSYRRNDDEDDKSVVQRRKEDKNKRDEKKQSPVPVEEAASEKKYTITKKNHRKDREYTQTGTLAELIKAYSYTLETGASYEHEKGNSKINCNPKAIEVLVSNLNKAADNAAANGDSGVSYSFQVAKSEPISEAAEQMTFAGWKRAAKKKHGDAVWFEGDKDIAQAMLGPQPYKRGETKGVGEWDGEKGQIYEGVKHRMKPLSEGKSFKRNDDDEESSVLQKRKEDKQKRDEKKQQPLDESARSMFPEPKQGHLASAYSYGEEKFDAGHPVTVLGTIGDDYIVKSFPLMQTAKAMRMLNSMVTLDTAIEEAKNISSVYFTLTDSDGILDIIKVSSDKIKFVNLDGESTSGDTWQGPVSFDKVESELTDLIDAVLGDEEGALDDVERICEFYTGKLKNLPAVTEQTAPGQVSIWDIPDELCLSIDRWEIEKLVDGNISEGKSFKRNDDMDDEDYSVLQKRKEEKQKRDEKKNIPGQAKDEVDEGLSKFMNKKAKPEKYSHLTDAEWEKMYKERMAKTKGPIVKEDVDKTVTVDVKIGARLFHVETNGHHVVVFDDHSMISPIKLMFNTQLGSDREKLLALQQAVVGAYKESYGDALSVMDALTKVTNLPSDMFSTRMAMNKSDEQNKIEDESMEMAEDTVGQGSTAEQLAAPVVKALQAIGAEVDTRVNDQGQVEFTLSTSNAQHDPANPYVLSPQNIGKAIDKFYREYRSAGHTFTQPVGGKFVIGEAVKLDELAPSTKNAHEAKSELNAAKTEFNKMSPFDKKYGALQSKIDRLTKEVAAHSSYGKSSDDVDEAARVGSSTYKQAARISQSNIERNADEKKHARKIKQDADEAAIKAQMRKQGLEEDVEFLMELGPSTFELKAELSTIKAKLDKTSPFDPEYRKLRNRQDDLEGELSSHASYGKSALPETKVEQPNNTAFVYESDWMDAGKKMGYLLESMESGSSVYKDNKGTVQGVWYGLNDRLKETEHGWMKVSPMLAKIVQEGLRLDEFQHKHQSIDELKRQLIDAKSAFNKMNGFDPNYATTKAEIERLTQAVKNSGQYGKSDAEDEVEEDYTTMREFKGDEKDWDPTPKKNELDETDEDHSDKYSPPGYEHGKETYEDEGPDGMQYTFPEGGSLGWRVDQTDEDVCVVTDGANIWRIDTGMDMVEYSADQLKDLLVMSKNAGIADRIFPR